MDVQERRIRDEIGFWRKLVSEIENAPEGVVHPAFYAALAAAEMKLASYLVRKERTGKDDRDTDPD